MLLELKCLDSRSRWVLWMMLCWATICVRAQVSGTSASTTNEVIGIWQGTLPATSALRVVIKLSKTDQGTLRGAFSFIDHDAEPTSLSIVVLQGQELSMASDLLGVGFRGALTANGASINGIWSQEKQTYPLTLVRVTPQTAWKHSDTVAISPMSTAANPAFEVATIKPSSEQRKGRRYEWRTRQFRAYNASVADLIKFAYQLRDRQIKGTPAWITEEKFDIAAEPDAPGLPSEQQYHIMMQKLLVERFGLSFRMEQQSFSVYALTRGSGDLKLTKGDSSFGLDGHITLKQEPEGDTAIRFTSESIPELLGILMNFIEDRQVVDETGLAGRFDFSITIPTAALQSPDSGDKASAFLRGVLPLGLRMVPKKANLAVMIVEGVQRPSPN